MNISVNAPIKAGLVHAFLHRADRLRVFSSQFEEDEIPVKELFRSMPSMPMLEPVSYTHLDVYKRQGEMRAPIRLL